MGGATHSSAARWVRRGIAGLAAILPAAFGSGRATVVRRFGQLTYLLLPLLASLAVGCGRDKEPVTTIQNVPDPAMQASAAPDPIDASSDGASKAADGSSKPPDDRSIVDLDSRRVYLPGRGWLTADEFRLIYQRRPEILPPDLDMALAHQLIGSPAEM